jgi:hypothetical protein
VLGPFQVAARPLTLRSREPAPKPAGSTPGGPIAWWKFDETAGTTAANAAGTNLQGQVQGPPHWAPGQSPRGGALEFDGARNWVTAANSTDLDFREGVTAAAWFKVRDTNQPAQSLLAKGDAWQLQCQVGRGLVMFALTGPAATAFGGGSPPVVTSKRKVNDGQWHHVAATYNGKRLALYVDGAEDGALKASGAVAVNNVPLTLGENDANRFQLFNGWMRDARLYTRGLSAEEVQTVYQSGSADRASK